MSVRRGGCRPGGGMAYAMAWRGGVSPVRLALAGIAVTSILTAMTSGVLVTSSFSAQIGLRWLIGGLQQRNWDDFWLLLPYFVVGTLLMLLMTRQVNVIALGDELATSLGQHVERTRFILAATAALLASAAVSIAGLVGFLGLIIPHLVRLLIGNDYRFVLPASALFGAILLVLADTAARTVLDPQELPVGRPDRGAGRAGVHHAGEVEGMSGRAQHPGKQRQRAGALLSRERTTGRRSCSARSWTRVIRPARRWSCITSASRSATARSWRWWGPTAPASRRCCGRWDAC